MSIISSIGRRSFKVRALYIAMYTFLLLGSATMVYPFLLMISGSTKSAVDIKYFDAIPRFLREDIWLYRKHVEALFNEGMLSKNIAYDDDTVAFDTIEHPPPPNMKLVNEWTTFLRETPLPPYAFTIGHLNAGVSRTTPMNLRRFKQSLKVEYGDSIDVLNKKLDTEFLGWNTLTLRPEQYLARRDKPVDSPFADALNAFKATQPDGLRNYFSPEGFYKKLFLKSLYTRDIGEYNRANGTAFTSYTELHLTRRVPTDGTDGQRTDWENFVRNTLAIYWIRADAGAADSYQAFLKAKYNSINLLNKNYHTTYADFESIPPIDEPPLSGLKGSDWEAFIAGWNDPETGERHVLPLEYLRIHSTEFLFRDYLEKKYGSVEAVNRALDTAFPDFISIPMPQVDVQFAWFLDNTRPLRWEFATRNYKTVADYLLLHGRGVINTVIYCSLAILLALVINPLAAYAMSRYKLPSSYKILLFLMCTMAFPPMVTQIPNFLILRRLGLLNTFAALVLPGMASGYAIFLLKGFFDAQPRELYESAQLDGASEWTIFWQITMSLSKPILAVIALQAFTGAYSNFMFAFVVCQDQKMWTLMVWLYQLQQRSGQAVMYASLIIAAIPTFLIFLFCQNMIMRGIVVPSEK